MYFPNRLRKKTLKRHNFSIKIDGLKVKEKNTQENSQKKADITILIAIKTKFKAIKYLSEELSGSYINYKGNNSMKNI